LKQHWEEAGLIKDFQVLDSDDQLRLLKRVNRELQIDEDRWPAKQCQWYINGQKDEGKRPHNIDPINDSYLKTMIKIYEAYELACQRGGMIDFGEILLRAHELWLKNPSLLEHYQRRFQHILVDEFQDTNDIQYAWLRVLAGRASNLMVVGDDDQSIYGWRGAKIENIQKFNTDFPGAELVKLEQNYRSTSNILNAANALISNNSGRLGKNLWTEDGDGEAISLYTALNEQDEARFVVDRAQDWFNNGNRRSESAILYRSNAQSRELEEALLRLGMPYRIYGGQRFYERLEIKNAISYLRLIANRDDDTAVERVINIPVRGIGGRTLEAIRKNARENDVSLWQACITCINESTIPLRAANSLLKFLKLIDDLEEGTKNLELQHKVDAIIKNTGLIPHHEKEGGEKARTRIENLDELINAASNFEPTELTEIPSKESAEFLTAFLDQAALDAGEGQAAAEEDAVQLMTLHSAKGLEFPLVFLVGLEEGLFPHKMSIDNLSGLEEERRLCYVGVTRAMSKLYICHTESRRLHGEINLCRPSRFIKEIPNDLVEEIRLKSSISRPAVGGGRLGQNNVAKSLNGSVEVPDTDLSLGQRVLHAKFGEGVILNYEGQGSSARVQVSFDDVGSKWLVLSFAKLQSII
jgi:DNA helicase-2/ATP-dependent DNA helicase PcrA